MEKDILNMLSDDGLCSKVNKYLTRFNPFDENLKNSLIFNYIWFSDPSKFNDPYDCNLSLKSECSYEEILKYLEEENNGVHFSYIRKRAQNLYQNPVLRINLLKKADQQTVENLGVCCFSQCNDTLLMWSHYANKHEGVSLTFDITQDQHIFSKKLFNVEYPTIYPIHNWPTDRIL